MNKVLIFLSILTNTWIVRAFYGTRVRQYGLSNQYIAQGIFVRLVCLKVDPNNNLFGDVVTWYRNGSVFKDGIRVGHTITIQLNTSASYSCTLKNTQSNITLQSSVPLSLKAYTIDGLATPVIQSKGQVDAGDNLTLTCQVSTDHPIKSYTFYENTLNDKVIKWTTEYIRWEFCYLKSTCLLNFTRVVRTTINKHSTYHCSVTTINGFTKNSKNVAGLVADLAHIELKLSKNSTIAGSILSLSCKISHLSSKVSKIKHYNWYRNGEILHITGRFFHTPMPTVNLTGLELGSSGGYTCSATLERTDNILVQSFSYNKPYLTVKPKLSIKKTFAHKWNSLSVQCEVLGGEGILSINKDNVTLKSREIYSNYQYAITWGKRISTRNDSGTYTCRMTSGNKTFEATTNVPVYYVDPPKLKLDNNYIDLKTNQYKVNYEAVITVNEKESHCLEVIPNFILPAFNLTWQYYQTNNVSRSTSEFKSCFANVTYDIHNTITFEALVPYMSGGQTYLRYLQRLFVAVRYKTAPKVSNYEVHKKARVGRSYSLLCLIYARQSPNITYNWYKNHTQVGNTSVYDIAKISYADDGNYTCVARNNLGQAKAVIVLTGLDVPDTPENITVKQTSTSSISLQWRKPFDGQNTITLYYVHIRKTSYFSMKCFSDSYPTGFCRYGSYNTTIDINNLEPFTAYTIKVSARNGVGTSKYSENIEASTLEGLSSQPRYLRYIKIGNEEELTWASPEHTNGMLLGYRICIQQLYLDGVVHDTSQSVQCTNKTVHEKIFALKNTDDFSLYNASIQAINSAGYGETANITFRTKEGEPENVRNVTTNISKSEIQLTWTKPFHFYGNFKEYAIKLQRLPFGVIEEVKCESIKKLMCSMKQLQPGTSYKVFIDVKNTISTTTTEIVLRTNYQAPTNIHPPESRIIGTMMRIYLPLFHTDAPITNYEILATKRDKSNVSEEWIVARMEAKTYSSLRVFDLGCGACNKGNITILNNKELSSNVYYATAVRAFLKDEMFTTTKWSKAKKINKKENSSKQGVASSTVVLALVLLCVVLV